MNRPNKIRGFRLFHNVLQYSLNKSHIHYHINIRYILFHKSAKVWKQPGRFAILAMFSAKEEPVNSRITSDV